MTGTDRAAFGAAEALCDLEAYAYDLPEELIAQNPADRRDGSRLLRLSRPDGAVAHRIFSELPDLLRPDDLLVLNDTRVFRARLVGRKLSGQGDCGAAAEIFCLNPTDDARVWRALVRPGRKLQPGVRVRLLSGDVVEIGERAEDGMRFVRLPDGVLADAFFERSGTLPLPPYIRHTTSEPERYQTVYADAGKKRSVAAPTAGLHFTDALFGALCAKGIERALVSLDVGVGTFRPVKTRDVRAHTMHAERCAIERGQAERINAARAQGRRIVAVGTTVVRTLESFAREDGTLDWGECETDIFIRPGYAFKSVDALITNFHLPRSTLLMLVSAFAGYEQTMAAYRAAVAARYRFFSFGDAMLVE